jgi:iron complex transport system permease protein
VFIQLFATKINILATGDDNAKAMGVNVENLRIILLMVSTFVVASIVSFTGLIGFVGMVSPHVARMFVGSDNRFLIPASIMFGASLMLVADTIGRVVIAPAVLEVGVITAFIGGPLFLYLVLSRKKSVW